MHGLDVRADTADETAAHTESFGSGQHVLSHQSAVGTTHQQLFRPTEIDLTFANAFVTMVVCAEDPEFRGILHLCLVAGVFGHLGTHFRIRDAHDRDGLQEARRGACASGLENRHAFVFSDHAIAEFTHGNVVVLGLDGRIVKSGHGLTPVETLSRILVIFLAHLID